MQYGKSLKVVVVDATLAGVEFDLFKGSVSAYQEVTVTVFPIQYEWHKYSELGSTHQVYIGGNFEFPGGYEVTARFPVSVEDVITAMNSLKPDGWIDPYLQSRFEILGIQGNPWQKPITSASSSVELVRLQYLIVSQIESNKPVRYKIYEGSTEFNNILGSMPEYEIHEEYLSPFWRDIYQGKTLKQ